MIVGCLPGPVAETTTDQDRLLIFHNNSGPMCLEALAWLASQESAHPELVVEEHLIFDPADLALLEQMKSQFAQSEGLSASFGYLPIIFFGNRAFLGFNDEVQAALAGLLDASDDV